MIVVETDVLGTMVIEPERREDDRGFFARTWCQREMTEHGLCPRFVQCNVSFSPRKGTLRGLHYQARPHTESKLVRCTMGAIYDVVVDLRSDSPTFKKWIAVELTAMNRRQVYVPDGCAHGFLTLADNSETFYQMSEYYAPDSARGVRWNDPVFGVEWPKDVKLISKRDRGYPDFATNPFRI